MSLLIGAGPMAIEYSRVLDAFDEEYNVVGRGEISAKRFEKETGRAVILEKLSSYLENVKVYPNAAIVSVGVEQLSSTSRELLEQGVKRILVEKPAGLTLQEVQELFELTLINNAEVYVAYNRRFYSSVKAARKIIEEDGGVEGFHFEVTEKGHQVEKISKLPEIKENWFLGNTSHVVDLAFFLGGAPIDITCFSSSKTDWHSRSANFAGAGVTKHNALFSYRGNWNAPGSWGVEILTKKNKLILCPLEKLQRQKLGSSAIEEVEIDDRLDQLFKPGLYQQLNSFLKGDVRNLCPIQEHLENCKHYLKMANY